MIRTPLIWPVYPYKTIDRLGKTYLFDPIRKKYVLWTPEEWVRQHVIHFLVTHQHFPRGHIQVETGLEFGALKKRSDILVRGPEGRAWILVECKAPHVKLTQASVNQVSRYNFKYRAPYLMLTNGLERWIFSIDWQAGTINPIADLPSYEVSPAGSPADENPKL